MFIAKRRIKCTVCKEWILPGELASFSFNRYTHAMCQGLKPDA